MATDKVINTPQSVNQLIENIAPTLVQNLPLFSPMLFDHHPNNIAWLNSETFSWQSGSVYSSAMEELVSDKATQTTASTDDYFLGLNNATVLGNPTITPDGVMSNMSSSNGLMLPSAFTPASNPWEMEL